MLNNAISTDLIVIGGGPGGYTAAELAGVYGLSVILINDGPLGGTCLNSGCVPTEVFLHTAKLFQNVEKVSSCCIGTGDLSFNHASLVEKKNRQIGILKKSLTKRLKRAGVTVVNGRAHILGKSGDTFSIEVSPAATSGDNDCNDLKSEVFSCKNLVIATGSSPKSLEITTPGVNTPNIYTNETIFDIPEIPEELAVIGSGTSGIELATYFSIAGSRITIFEKENELGCAGDRDIKEILLRNLSELGIEIHFGIDKINTKIPNIFTSIGRTPNIEGLGLENIGIISSDHNIDTDNSTKTNMPGVYAIGDVNGKSLLAHTAYREAACAVNNILGNPDSICYPAIPKVTHSLPELAFVGLTELEAISAGIETRCISLPMIYSTKYFSENEGGDGEIKLTFKVDNHQFIGATCLHDGSGELITTLSLFIQKALTYEDMRNIIFPHPSYGEVIREALLKPWKNS